ncbi:hypothetical protein E2562_023877 [Oryza meyeriana var. granulata]|uniref:Secreted protein n=1 Tax=Oryza meyeriana var. granulata TaxID=110450 RepID=A0A6G1D7A2_9ORYZ|nr:hypothetical protein E2562_023877 [Oryza meyeriana var. granulata]
MAAMPPSMLLGVLLITGKLCEYAATSSAGGGGFSICGGPWHMPLHPFVLVSASSTGDDVVVPKIVSLSFKYLMAVNISSGS